MIKRVLLTLLAITLIITFIILIIIAYFLIADIQSKTPQKIDCEVITKEFIGRKVFIIEPKVKSKSKKYILYFHGGSYVAETSNEHWNFLENLSKDTGYSIILPDYPLTPKYNYKDVFGMIEPLYKEIIEKIDPEELIMMGDSAGGGMALALEEKLGEEYQKLPERLILISPWLDTRMTNPEIDKIQPLDKDLKKEALKIAGIAYSGEDGKDNYLVNPIDGPIEKLKNVTIYTGTYDILNPDVHTFIKRAKEKNIDIDLEEYDKQGHIWLVKDTKTQAYIDLINSIKI